MGKLCLMIISTFQHMKETGSMTAGEERHRRTAGEEHQRRTTGEKVHQMQDVQLTTTTTSIRGVERSCHSTRTTNHLTEMAAGTRTRVKSSWNHSFVGLIWIMDMYRESEDWSKMSFCLLVSDSLSIWFISIDLRWIELRWWYFFLSFRLIVDNENTILNRDLIGYHDTCTGWY